MVYRGDPDKTVFFDHHEKAAEVYRVQTETSIYYVSFHEERGRKYVVVRGAPGTDREHVVVRDSDPRVGEHSMFELPPGDWIGKAMDVASMRTSPITSVRKENAIRAGAREVRVSLDAPAPKSPRGLAQGTAVGQVNEKSRQVVVGEPSVPYPERHVRHAEDCAQLLRSIHRRDHLFADIDAAQRGRIQRSLADCEALIVEIKKRYAGP
jgi:hypothetical protein